MFSSPDDFDVASLSAFCAIEVIVVLGAEGVRFRRADRELCCSKRSCDHGESTSRFGGRLYGVDERLWLFRERMGPGPVGCGTLRRSRREAIWIRGVQQKVVVEVVDK